jgi:capsular polysaccharide biosynthesis protein
MKPTEPVHFRPDSADLINLVIRHWKLILIICIVTAITAALLSLLITPLYRSAVVLYPTTNVIESQTLFGDRNSPRELFGDETATEKVLQILRSDNIKNYLVKKYDLMKHYNIGDNARYKYTLLNMKMNKYIISRKTQFNSIEISVLDPDPKIASAMANDMAFQVDTLFNMIVKDAGRKSFNALNNSYNDQFRRVKSLEDSLRFVTPPGPAAVYPGNLKAGKVNSIWGTSLGIYSPEYLRLINMFESENENLSSIRSRLTESKMIAEQDLPYIHIINEARVSEKKAQPRRTLIVGASTLSVFVLLIFILGLADLLKRDEK